MNRLREQGDNPYPYKFHVSMSVPEFIEKYSPLVTGDRKEDQTITLAGRVHNIRSSGKNLKFYDLHSEGVKVQIMAQAQ